MLLRESGRHDGIDHHFEAINGEALDRATVDHAQTLNDFAQAFFAQERFELNAARQAVLDELGAAALADASATVAIFNAVVRIADATGVPLEEYKIDGAADLREQLGQQRHVIGEIGRSRLGDELPAQHAADVVIVGQHGLAVGTGPDVGLEMRRAEANGEREGLEGIVGRLGGRTPVRKQKRFGQLCRQARP